MLNDECLMIVRSCIFIQHSSFKIIPSRYFEIKNSFHILYGMNYKQIFTKTVFIVAALSCLALISCKKDTAAKGGGGTADVKFYTANAAKLAACGGTISIHLTGSDASGIVYDNYIDVTGTSSGVPECDLTNGGYLPNLRNDLAYIAQVPICTAPGTGGASFSLIADQCQAFEIYP
jgi:hypothetical protein